jgi:murein DD-endopeptidase MepM/ murein hydrolase activator NlpD
VANHRAPRHSASRTGTTDGVHVTPTAPAAPVAGKRKAEKPSRIARTRSRRPQTPPLDATPPVVAPVIELPTPPVAAPVAARIAEPVEPTVRIAEPVAPATTEIPAAFVAPEAPAVKAATRGHARSRNGSRKPLFPMLPSAPTAVGAAALVIAATGAITVTQPTEEVAAASSMKGFVPASAFTGTSAATSRLELDSRMQAVSRDSERTAAGNAADDELLAAVEAQAEERNAALAQLAASAEKYAGEIAANAWRLPLAGYSITARFGYSSSLWSSTHTGLDFAAPYGTPVVSVANGVVRSTGYDGSYGNKVVIAHEDGTETWYAHLSAITVSPGESVNGGDLIGNVGSTGNSTGDHLHLEVRPGAGDPVDPYAALIARGVTP